MKLLPAKFILKGILFACITGFLFATFQTLPKNREEHWNWKEIDHENITFPDWFKFGVATSEYQLSGNKNSTDPKKIIDSNWAIFERTKDWFGNPYTPAAGKGVDHWSLFKQDIQLVKNLGVTVYRLSLDWARIEPQQGVINTRALKHYHNLFDECAKNGITPIVTLHHFVEPAWFTKKGGFEKEGNIQYFVSFALQMVKEFSSKVSTWATINEPGVYAVMGYIFGDFPPGKRLRFAQAGRVIENLLKAHLNVYKAIKDLPEGNKLEVGIVHNIVQFDPYHPNNPIERWFTGYLNHIFSDAILTALKTGTFSFSTPLTTIYWHNPALVSSYDFFGLNYYSHVLFNILHPYEPVFRPETDEVKTDLQYGLYAEGLYRAIKAASSLNVPIYITENGLADAKDILRDRWYRRYLYATHKAIQDGYDVRMFCAWSLMDNYEWNHGYDKQFGLYHVDRTTQKRTLRPGAEYFKQVATKHHLKPPAKKETSREQNVSNTSFIEEPFFGINEMGSTEIIAS